MMEIRPADVTVQAKDESRELTASAIRLLTTLSPESVDAADQFTKAPPSSIWI